jgi:hypothetical protein
MNTRDRFRAHNFFAYQANPGQTSIKRPMKNLASVSLNRRAGQFE